MDQDIEGLGTTSRDLMWVSFVKALRVERHLGGQVQFIVCSLSLVLIEQNVYKFQKLQTKLHVFAQFEPLLYNNIQNT